MTNTKTYHDDDWQIHRDGKPAVEYSDGTQEWWYHGDIHREDGPAIIGADGYKAWYVNGFIHREDGPAVIYADGTKEYWLHGKYYQDVLAYFIAVKEYQQNQQLKNQ